MSRRRLFRAGLALPLLLGACQAYRPSPLASPGSALAAPDPAVLVADAAHIDRPYLQPQPIDLSRPLTPNAVAILAVIASPELKALRARNAVADAQSFAANLLPDPQVSANFDRIISGPDVFNAFGGSLALDVVNALRTAHVRHQQADAQRRQVRLDLAWAEWQAAGQARLQAARIVALEQQLPLATASASSAQDLFAATARAAARGDVSGADLDVRRQATLDASDRLRTTQNDLATARGELNRQLGLPPEMRVALAPPSLPTPTPPAQRLVALALARRLDLAALRAGYESAEADAHRAVLEQFPALTLSVSYAQDTAHNRTLGPAVNYALPLWNRNRGAVRTSLATRAQLQAEYAARLFQTRAEIAAAVAGIASVRGQAATIEAQMPALARHAEASGAAARRGDLAPATAATAEQALRDRQSTLLQLRQQATEQTVALEILTGSLSEGWTS